MIHGIPGRLYARLAIPAVLLFTVVSVLWAQPPEQAGGPRTVAYVNITELFGIKPGTLVIKQGVTVIWLNQSSSAVEVRFTSRQVSLSCINPANFHVSADGFFVSDAIAPGAVASLCFVESGSFDYVLSTQASGPSTPAVPVKPLAGTIIVES